MVRQEVEVKKGSAVHIVASAGPRPTHTSRQVPLTLLPQWCWEGRAIALSPQWCWKDSTTVCKHQHTHGRGVGQPSSTRLELAEGHFHSPSARWPQDIKGHHCLRQVSNESVPDLLSLSSSRLQHRRFSHPHLRKWLPSRGAAALLLWAAAVLATPNYSELHGCTFSLCTKICTYSHLFLPTLILQIEEHYFLHCIWVSWFCVLPQMAKPVRIMENAAQDGQRPHPLLPGTSSATPPWD